MKRHGMNVAGILLTLVLGLPFEAAAQKNLATERVSLVFRDKLASDVFPVLARALEYDLSLDPKLDAMLTIELESVTARTALDAICDSIACSWRAEGKRLVIDNLSQYRVTIEDTAAGKALLRRGANPMGLAVASLDDLLPYQFAFGPASLDYIFYAVARMLDADVEVPALLRQRKVTIQLPMGTGRQALDALCAKVGCRWEMVDGRPRHLLRITAR